MWPAINFFGRIVPQLIKLPNTGIKALIKLHQNFTSKLFAHVTEYFT